MSAFVKNTQTFFNQTTAPTGWTKLVAVDDYTLRVVSGSTGGTVGGTNGVTSAFVNSTWPGTISSVTGTIAPATADLPSHQHTFNYESVGPVNQGQIVVMFNGPPTTDAVSTIGLTSSNPGGSSADHAHGIAVSGGTVTGGPTGFAVTYVDFILASKN